MTKVIFLAWVAIAMGCAGTDKATAEQQNPVPAEQQPPAPAAKAPTVDELDISIRDASDYLNENIPKGNKIVILNIQSNSSDLSDYIIDELIANAVNDGFFTVVDRQQLDAIRNEQKFQLSGAVDDKDALAIGKLFGAQTIVSGAVNRLGTGYRIRIRALEVQTAQVQGQFNRNIAESKTVNSLMEGGGVASGGTASSGYAAGTATSTVSTASTAAPAVQATAPASKPVAAPPITGTPVPGGSLAEKLAWLQRSADSHNTYILEVNADENISPHTFEYKGAINITIVLRGDNENRTIRLSQNGNMFTVGANVTFILDNNITLHGHNGNTNVLIYVKGGTFKMNAGSTLTGNIRDLDKSAGGAVYVEGGTFEMNGGTISGNVAGSGGGVSLAFARGSKTIFTMAGGTISNNTANFGGGVYMYGVSFSETSSFTMNGGAISSNTAKYGGGVYVNKYCEFKRCTFIIKDGIIAKNTAKENGGGVFIYKSYSSAPFTKTRGTITGYKNDPNNGNVVKDEDGNVLARRGHAVYVDENTRKETTAGPGENLSYEGARNLFETANISGAWDQ